MGAMPLLRQGGLALAFAVILAAPAADAAGDRRAGRQKAQPCHVCHGADGIAKMPEAPNLAGQSEIYTGKSLREYRSGQRKNEIMEVIAKPLADKDIDDLAAFYAAIEVQATVPP
jgi:cytochrome c553